MKKIRIRLVAAVLLALALGGLAAPAHADPVPNPRDTLYKITHVCQYAYCNF